MMRNWFISVLLPWLVVGLLAGPVRAGGGPHNVMIVANRASADSVFVANAYRRARGVPQRNLCLLDLPVESFRTRNKIPQEVFQEKIVQPIKTFLQRHPAADRLHFIVLCPDLPLRVDFGGKIKTRSLAALLTVLGLPPGGRPVPNPYFNQRLAFESRKQSSGRSPDLRLVTWLRGYQRSDALALIERSLAADGTTPKGAFYFVLSPHVRRYQEAVTWLQGRGMKAQLLASGKPVRGAGDVMGYFSGGSYSGLRWKDISSNTYLPGALVDMLESYGAEWPNWRTFGYNRQVPVPWFVRAGASGVHGTTDEPYAAAFPSSGHSETFFANYLAGNNLAETYWSAIPVLAWQNAVFGDPLCAPYAVRSKVELSVESDQASRTHRVAVRITPPKDAATPREVRLFVDGRLVQITREIKQDHGQFVAAVSVDARALPDGWHTLRAVAVDDSPAAVQSWAEVSLQTAAGGRSLSVKLSPSKLKAAAGDRLTATVAYAGQPKPASIVLRAGALDLGLFRGGKLSFSTAALGPGNHRLQAVALDAQGNPLALGNPLEVELIEPLHVVDVYPQGAVGRRPKFLLRYSEVPPLAQGVLARAVRLSQGTRKVPTRVRRVGRNLIIEPRSSLAAGAACRLSVTLAQGAVRSRDFRKEFTPVKDAKLLFGLSKHLPFRNTVEGMTSSSAAKVSPIWRRPAKVVLGPVDLYSPKRPALWSLAGYSITGRLSVSAAARPEKQDTRGIGLGVHYSDIDNLCYVRIERAKVVVHQVLGGKHSTLKSWPMPGGTTGTIAMTLEVAGPQLAVTVAGKKLGMVRLDLKLPPGLPMIDLGAAAGISALDVKVRRP
ncbi:MAG: TIGR03790 family protein [Anaerolineaceae bacterium]|nr:TIGR03790 family protein [Anaerolineaceae bacterium]